MVKATAGGGGRGIRLVNSPEQLDEAFERASSEASKTAGDATVFLERAIRGGLHVEVQSVVRQPARDHGQEINVPVKLRTATYRRPRLRDEGRICMLLNRAS